MALSMIPTVYGRFVSGFTHMSATLVAMSRNMASSCECRSFSETCSSPLARICSREWGGAHAGYCANGSGRSRIQSQYMYQTYCINY